MAGAPPGWDLHSRNPCFSLGDGITPTNTVTVDWEWHCSWKADGILGDETRQIHAAASLRDCERIRAAEELFSAQPGHYFQGDAPEKGWFAK